MASRPITLYAFSISPFVNKVAAILDYKKIPYRAVHIHPLKKAEIQFSTKKLVPIIDDGGTVVEDSTDIALYLERTYPTPPTLPADPAARTAVLAIEEWLDDSFVPRFFVANNLGRAANRRRVMQLFATTTPFSAVERIALPLLSRFVMRKIVREAESNLPGAPQALDELERKLGAGPFLGEQPQVSLADLTAFAELSFVVDLGLEGADEITRRPALRAWLDRVRPLTSDGRRLMAQAA